MTLAENEWNRCPNAPCLETTPTHMMRERERERQELMISKQENREMLNIVICVYTPYWKEQKLAMPTVV
jgi:hypothetical protein